MKSNGDFIAVSDSIYEHSNSKVNFVIKQRRLKQKQGKPLFKSHAEQRMDDIEERMKSQRELTETFEEAVQVTEIRNKVHLYN
jgi:hypothetical protein